MQHSCPISGLTWTSNPVIPNSPVSTLKHPIFHFSYSTLLDHLDYHKDSTESETTYLLGLAMLSHFPVTFTYPVSPDSFPKILQHWDTLVSLFTKLPLLDPSEYPRYNVTKDTRNLYNLSHYLDSVSEVHQSYSTKVAEQRLARSILRKEEVISRLIGHPSSRTKLKLASLLPDWADLVCNFPKSQTTLPDGSLQNLNEYWKTLIRLCILGDTNEIMKIASAADLDELLYELEESLELGTSCAVLTLKYVRDICRAFLEFSQSGIQVRSSIQLDLSSLDDPGSEFQEDPAPARPGKPKRSDFPTVKEFIYALRAWSKSYE